MPTIDLSKKKKEFKPTIALHDGKIFIAVDGEPDLVIQGRIRVDRVYKYLEDGGQSVIDPRNKLPMFEIESGIDFKIIPKSEFDAIKKASWGLQWSSTESKHGELSTDYAPVPKLAIL